MFAHRSFERNTHTAIRLRPPARLMCSPATPNIRAGLAATADGFEGRCNAADLGVALTAVEMFVLGRLAPANALSIDRFVVRGVHMVTVRPVRPPAQSDRDSGHGRHGRSRDFVQSLERGLSIIRTFSANRPLMTVSELAEETGLTRAAARRFVLTLVELGYIQAKGSAFELAPAVLELGYAYLSGLSFPEVALPRIERLVAETAEASEGSILDGGDILYVLRVRGPSRMTISVNIGERRAAHATSMGRVLLAYLPLDELDEWLAHHELSQVRPRTINDPQTLRIELEKVRRAGYAVIDQELEDGLIAVAVPVRDRLGRVRAAINLSTHIGRKSLDELLSLLPTLQEAADDIETNLRHALIWSD